METKTTDFGFKFTLDGIMSYLSERSVCGVMDADTLSKALDGRLSRQMICRFTRLGELVAISYPASKYIYRTEDVARFLKSHPRYLFSTERGDNSDMTDERVMELTSFIRNYVRKEWSPLLKVLDMDDIVQETLMMMLRWRRRNGVSDATVVFRALSKIWRKNRKRMSEIVADGSEIEKEFYDE